MVKEFIDLSVPMKSLDTAVFPGYPQPLKSTYTTVRDEGYASYLWIFAEHTGTHVDSPAHFFPNSFSIDRVPLEKYVGPGVVLDFSKKPPMYSITKDNVVTEIKATGRKVGKGWILLFYTGYTAKSKTDEWMKHPELSEEACRYLADLQVNAIGFDAPSPDHQPFPGHKILLPKVIGIFENLTNLERLLGIDFIFVGAPIKLYEGSASPVRAFAMLF